MTGQLTTCRMTVPPSRAANGRAPTARRHAVRGPSASVFAAKAVFAAIAIVTAATLIVTAPQTVTIPLAVVLGSGLVASGLVVLVDRQGSFGRRRRRGRLRHQSRRSAEGWGVLGAVSVGLLVLALLAPEGLGVALAAIGLAGLMVFRLGAMYGGWVPPGTIPAESPPARNDHPAMTEPTLIA